MPPSMDVVVKTLRCILNTTKNGLSEQQLRQIYREMEGQEIPYKKFHFNALYDFLYASNEFHMFSTRRGLYVRARLTQNSMHIVKLVGAQNCVRKKKTMKYPPKSSGNQNKRNKNLKWPNQNTKSSRNQLKRNLISKANLKGSNRMISKEEFNGNQKMVGSQVQRGKYAQPMMKWQNSENSQLVARHFWLHKFFKQVKFLLKHIAANPIVFDENHMECFNEVAKICVWKEIAHDFKSLSLQNDSSDAEHSQDESTLPSTQKLIENRLSEFIKLLNRCSKCGPENPDYLDYSETYYAIDTPEQAEITDYGLVDFLQNVAFILECIAANPALYDHNTQMHHEESIKFSIWNHICTVYYGKLQNNDFELTDEDVHFEIKYLQRTIERHLNRLTKPLTMLT